MFCPTSDERTRADVAARQRLTGQLKLTALDLSLAQETELARRERELELLALILRDPTDVTQAFTTGTEELRESITDPQREALVAVMEDFERERFESRTPAEDAEFIRSLEAMGKVDGVLPTWLASCDAGTLRRMAALLVSTLTAKSSSTD